MIGWYSNNPISRTVMLAIDDSGVNVRHISEFGSIPSEESIFYGILRGSGIAMRVMDHLKINYHYIDNGYFDAMYIDEAMQKKMTGKFRVVKNDTVEPYVGAPPTAVIVNPLKIAAIIPPSPYSAHHYSTTPEDWLAYAKYRVKLHGFTPVVRSKDSKEPLADFLKDVSFMVSMHSMTCMKAAEMGIPSYDTHGIYRNFPDLERRDFVPKLYAAIDQLKAFYEPKQFTLEEIKQGKVKWN